jgi:hypothetical protein
VILLAAGAVQFAYTSSMMGRLVRAWLVHTTFCIGVEQGGEGRVKVTPPSVQETSWEGASTDHVLFRG